VNQKLIRSQPIPDDKPIAPDAIERIERAGPITLSESGRARLRAAIYGYQEQVYILANSTFSTDAQEILEKLEKTLNETNQFLHMILGPGPDMHATFKQLQKIAERKSGLNDARTRLKALRGDVIAWQSNAAEARRDLTTTEGTPALKALDDLLLAAISIFRESSNAGLKGPTSLGYLSKVCTVAGHSISTEGVKSRLNSMGEKLGKTI
jgi:hypothetical protein